MFVNGTEIYKFKAKEYEIKDSESEICLGNISTDFSADNMKKTGLYGRVNDFGIDFNSIAVNDISNGKEQCEMMIGFIRKCFFTAKTFFSFDALNLNSLECASANNQKCKIRSEIINVNTNEPIFFPYSITINKCKGSCNTINDPYAKICVPDTIKTINVKVFNLMSRTNETRHVEWHKTWNVNVD